ncbi:1890_t:CDS:2 [Funneliformis caledonium]|uniref:1890_t:CDS:1 n=1 Tax=Funneliformis caledonium TaxID=1117310 RepID=A0A9N9FRC2_9GLOM|nr:1890_t:CDS:2 [Funneliformis caledonium]
MSIAEDKWSIHQSSQVPPSSQHQHPEISSQVSSMPAENFMQSFTYDGQAPQGQMHQQIDFCAAHVFSVISYHNEHSIKPAFYLCFVQTGFGYASWAVHCNNGVMFIPPKQEIDTTPNRSQNQYQSSVSMSAPVTPSTPRQNGSPIGTPITPVSAPPDCKNDNRPTITANPYHATQFQQQVIRKRRDNSLGFPPDAGPFFSQTQQHHNIYSMDRSNSYKLRINSKVDRGFFLADNDWTCYRRNYFQISSAFSVTGTSHAINESEVPCLIEVEGQFHTVTHFSLGISARVSNSDKKIELVQHTPKRDKGPQMTPVPKPIRAGGNLNLSSVGTNTNIVTFERIQFKTATANNGKRRAAQQYYVVMVDLYAHVESGDPYRVATATSAPLVVRGRSPGHYADSHDRFNPIGMHPTFPNDGRQHITFPGPNSAPGMMPPDFNAPPFPGPYGQYPPFQGYPPNGPMRNDALSIMMSTGAPNPAAPHYHSQHPPHYMVQNIHEGENPNPEMYNNPNMDPNNLEVSTSTAPATFANFESRPITTSASDSPAVTGAKPYMKIEIPQSSQVPNLPNHPLTSPVFHSQEYVESFGMYHNNGHPAHAAAVHSGGYHSDSEQHHSNGPNKQKDDTQQNSENIQDQPSPQVNGGDNNVQSNNINPNDKGSKSPVSVNGTNESATKINPRSK